MIEFKCEHRYNVVTQDVDIKTFRKLISPNAAATLENYMAKTNIKIGGLNHAVEHENPEVMRELTVCNFFGRQKNLMIFTKSKIATIISKFSKF